MEDQIDAADFVQVMATETYERRRRGREEPGKGLGVRWEGAIISQALYDAALDNRRFAAVILDGDTAHIPFFLKSGDWYDLSTGDDYGALYRRLTEQPAVRKPKPVRINRGT